MALACVPSLAGAVGARVRWLPSPDVRVVGYFLYVRPAGAPYTTPIDVRVPARDPDGSMHYDIANLPPGAYVFAVSGHTAAPVEETQLSAEGRLGPPPPACTLDGCTAPTVCDIGVAPDGTACGSESTDPGGCEDTCLAGSCAPRSVASLQTTRLRVQVLPTEIHVLLRGRVVTADIPALDETGLDLTIRDGFGGSLVDLAIPPSAIRRTTGWLQFALAQPQTTVGAASVERLTARPYADGWNVRLTLVLPGPATAGIPALWTLRAGNRCASDAALECDGDARRVVCH